MPHSESQDAARPKRQPRTGATGRPAAFIDRDGTLLVERHYLSDPARVELFAGAVEALHRLREAGYALVVVTNQSGIARGLYAERDYHAVRQRLDGMLREAGVPLDGVYHCPHHPDFTGPCDCRKPGLGLFLRASRELGLDPARSVFIGDRLKDVLPAAAFGGRGILVRTGYGRQQESHAPADIEIVDDLLEAAARAANAAARNEDRAAARVDTPETDP